MAEYTPNTSESNITSSSDINLNIKKNFYEVKKAREILDEEFKEFTLRKRNVQEFFSIYNNKFYEILKDTHSFFMQNSLYYLKEWTNPREITIKGLETQLINVQYEIDSIEKYHPIIPNGVLLCTHPNKDQWGYDNNIIDFVYYIQSGKKRHLQNIEVFNELKFQTGNPEKTNREFLIKIDQSLKDSITTGKPISSIEDINDSDCIVNTWPLEDRCTPERLVYG